MERLPPIPKAVRDAYVCIHEASSPRPENDCSTRSIRKAMNSEERAAIDPQKIVYYRGRVTNGGGYGGSRGTRYRTVYAVAVYDGGVLYRGNTTVKIENPRSITVAEKEALYAKAEHIIAAEVKATVEGLIKSGKRQVAFNKKSNTPEYKLKVIRDEIKNTEREAKKLARALKTLRAKEAKLEARVAA